MDIYKQHESAFARVSAFVILKDGERVATIALKFPADGSGRLYAYVHWIGLEMVRGFAPGGGYDKRSAAIASAARKMPVGLEMSAQRGFVHALSEDGCSTWDGQLRDAGFTVLQAV